MSRLEERTVCQCPSCRCLTLEENLRLILSVSGGVNSVWADCVICGADTPLESWKLFSVDEAGKWKETHV